jgi:hypothetical protein
LLEARDERHGLRNVAQQLLFADAAGAGIVSDTEERAATESNLE